MIFLNDAIEWELEWPAEHATDLEPVLTRGLQLLSGMSLFELQKALKA